MTTDLLTYGLGLAWALCAACILVSVYVSEGVERVGFDIRRKVK